MIVGIVKSMLGKEVSWDWLAERLTKLLLHIVTQGVEALIIKGREAKGRLVVLSLFAINDGKLHEIKDARMVCLNSASGSLAPSRL
jgi:hypothetical protein